MKYCFLPKPCSFSGKKLNRSLMETIPDPVTDLPHRKALGKGLLEDSFTLTLFSLHFKGQHFLRWWQCIFLDFYFFWK